MKFIILFGCFLASSILYAQEFSIKFSIEPADGHGGSASDCSEDIWCFDLYGEPSIDGAVLKSYEIWFQIVNEHGDSPSDVVYHSDESSMLYDQNDLPLNGATTFIRVAGDESLTGHPNILKGKTKIHNFCIRNTGSISSEGVLLIAGSNMGGLGSNMSVQLNGFAVDALIVEDTIDLFRNNPCCTNSLAQNLIISAQRADGLAKVVWKKPDDLSADVFTVEHSSEGRSFREIGTVNRSTDPTDAHSHFVFDHEDVRSGNNYYRIRAQSGDLEVLSNVAALYFDNLTEFTIAPNPSSNHIRIGWQASTPIDRIRIIDNLGQVVFEKKLVADSDRLSIDISKFPAGLYKSQFIKGQGILMEKEFVKIE